MSNNGSVSFSQAFLFEGQLIYLVKVCRSFSFLVYHSLKPIFFCHSGIFLDKPDPQEISRSSTRFEAIHRPGSSPVLLYTPF